MPERERERQTDGGKRERLRGDGIGLAALAGGYNLCCHGNSTEEEEEALVSVSSGGTSPPVCRPSRGYHTRTRSGFVNNQARAAGLSYI